MEKGIGHAAWQQLTPDELELIAACVREVTISAAGDDYREIRQKIEQLDKAARHFAELMMNTEVMGAMKGQTMEAAGEGMGIMRLPRRTPSPRPNSKRGTPRLVNRPQAAHSKGLK